MKRLLVLLLALLLFTTSAYAADSLSESVVRVTTTQTQVTLTCVADTDGSFSETTDWPLQGYLVLAQSDPGTVTPTADYDIAINNADGVDLMGGAMDDRGYTPTERARPKVSNSYGPVAVNGPVTVVWTGNTADSAEVVITLYYYTF